MNWKKIILIFTSLLLFGTASSAVADEILPFTGQKQIQLGELDSFGRATTAHIQLQAKDQPQKSREPRLSYNPKGWHNYKFTYENSNGKKAWLMNRGHLIGHQFSGLDNEGRNLVPITAMLNSGKYKGTTNKNQDSMLYYENRLNAWLKKNKNYWLDYQVTAIYKDSELIPRQIQLRYVGLDEKGNRLKITLGGKETVDDQGNTTVTLDNTSPNAEINYATGTATFKVPATSTTSSSSVSSSKTDTAPSSQGTPASEQAPAPQPEVPAPQPAPEPAQPTLDEDRIVYVARNGSAAVYWYDINRMPSNTNFKRVVSMTESQAKAAGKRPSLRE